MNEGSGDSLGGDNSTEVRDLQEGRERERDKRVYQS